jgi:hypothetical protein
VSHIFRGYLAIRNAKVNAIFVSYRKISYGKQDFDLKLLACTLWGVSYSKVLLIARFLIVRCRCRVDHYRRSLPLVGIKKQKKRISGTARGNNSGPEIKVLETALPGLNRRELRGYSTSYGFGTQILEAVFLLLMFLFIFRKIGPKTDAELCAASRIISMMRDALEWNRVSSLER